MEYCCAAWIDASYFQKVRLIRLQNEALRLVLGVPRRLHLDEQELCRRANLPPLEKRWAEVSAAFACRALSTTPPVGQLIMDQRGLAVAHGTPLGRFSRLVQFGPSVGSA